jgi:hypothetical protein
MVTVEQQLEELATKVDKLSMGVDLANNGVVSLTKTVSKITDRWAEWIVGAITPTSSPLIWMRLYRI